MFSIFIQEYICANSKKSKYLMVITFAIINFGFNLVGIKNKKEIKFILFICFLYRMKYCIE